MRRTERVVDVEDLLLVRLHGRAELIKQSRSEPRRLGLARRILQTADGRLRAQRRPGLRTAADRNLHERIVPQPIEINGILVSAGDRCDARHHHLEHRVPDAVRIAAIGIASASRRHTPSLRSACRSSNRLPSDDWLPPSKSTVISCGAHLKVEGKRRIVGHGGCGARLIRDAIRLNTDLLRESLALRHSRH